MSTQRLGKKFFKCSIMINHQFDQIRMCKHVFQFVLKLNIRKYNIT